MEEIRERIRKACLGVFGVSVEPEVEAASGQKFSDGREVDVASNIALRIAKELEKSPREVAERLAEELRGEGIGNDTGAGVSSAEDGAMEGAWEVEVAGPGFLNFILSDGYLEGKTSDLVTNFDENISWGEYSGKTVICEFSDPNPFKVLHVGHLYTSIVGDAIARLYTAAGARVVRANFGGDVGLHVAKNIWKLLQRKGEIREGMSLDEKAELMGECYVEGTRAYEEDEAARAEIVELNKQIYDKTYSDEVRELYEWGRETSYAYFKEFYAKVGVVFDKYYPESEVAERGVVEVRKHPETYVESDGAVVFNGEDVGLHTRVFINSEGVPTYEAKDVGLLFTKYEDYQFDRSVVITGSEQKDYMAVVLASIKTFAPELVERTVHLTHGLVKLPGKVKMSSRKGNFLKAVEVLDMVREKLDDEKIVMAAVKFGFLKSQMGPDIEFDLDKSVAMSGMSGPYLQYSAVRVKKILSALDKKAGSGNYTPNEYERALMKKIIQYPNALKTAAEEMAPQKICGYLYETAQEFSRFYENVKVAGGEHEAERGEICRAYLKVMTHGLLTLGIEIPEEM